MALSHVVMSFMSWLHEFLHPELAPVYAHMTLIDKLLFHIIHFVDRYYAWYKLPVFFGLVYLEIRRTLHQRYNLINVGRSQVNIRSNPAEISYRTDDGKFGDPFDIAAGEQGSFFGRNMLPANGPNKILDPHPSVVATKLLARKKFADTGKQFNMLAASWIQFMIHDWVDHLEDTEQVEITAPAAVANSCPLKSFKFYPSKEFPTGSDIKTGYRNQRTPWWDGSVICGSNEKVLKKVRTYKDGKLRLASNGLLEHDSNGVAISGDDRNGWAGLSVLQALFVKEHNSICDMLKKHYPKFQDEELYRRARLVTSAVIAKIHTIDWTVELLKMDTLLAGMRANWYGLLGKTFKDTFGHTGVQVLSGYVGMPKPVNHGVPYSLTEEFVSVYRMHSLLPDSISVRDIKSPPSSSSTKTPPLLKEVPMKQLVGPQGEPELGNIGNETMIVSMGHQACGALTLWNYPLWMRDLTPQDIDGISRRDHVDLPSLEIYRDREHNVPRYNEFRRNMLMIPIKSWGDLTSDEETIATLVEVYGEDVEKLDLLVGLLAEKKIKGYAISETAFYIFVLMASRRLEADRFFTSDFNANVYTKEGLAWVNTTEGLKDVIVRHHGHMVEKWLNSGISAFTLWSADPEPSNPIPLYLRTPS